MLKTIFVWRSKANSLVHSVHTDTYLPAFSYSQAYKKSIIFKLYLFGVIKTKIFNCYKH